MWMSGSSAQLYRCIQVCTVGRTNAGPSENFEVKVGLQQGSVLSPLLFTVAIDVVSSEVVCLLSYCMLMTYDLCHQQWSNLVDMWVNGVSLFDNELKVYAGK